MLYLLLAALTTPLLAETFEFVPVYKPDEKLYYSVSKTRERPGQPARKSKTCYEVTRGGLSSEGQVISWRPGVTEIDGASPQEMAVLSKLEVAAKGLSYHVKLGAGGKFEGLANEKELLEFSATAVDEMIAAMPGEPAQKKQAEEMLRKLFTPRVMLQGIERDMRLIYAFSGRALDSEKPVTTTVEAPVPMGGGKMRLNVAIETRRVEPGGAVEVRSTQKPDPADLRRMVTALIEQTGGVKPGDKGQLEAAMQRLESTDTTVSRYDLKRGYPSRVDFKRVVGNGAEAQTDTTVIEESSCKP